MQYVPLGANAYSNNEYGLPEVRLENWFPESAPDKPNRPFRLIPSPGLDAWCSGLNGAVRGMFQADGLLSGELIAAAGLRAYRIDSGGAETEIGTITGTDGVSFAGSQLDLVMTAGGTAYKVNSGSLASIALPGGGDVIDVAEFGQRHLFLEAETGRFWWSDVADCTTIGAASFGTAASEPDNLLAIEVYNGTVMLFGTQSTEGWAWTGDADVPFVQRPGFAVDVGIIARDAKTTIDFGLFLVGSDGLVYRLDGFQPRRISTDTIDRLIEDVAPAERANIRLSSHKWGGHVFVGLHLPGVGDYFYDVSTQSWHRRKEIGNARHLAHDFLAFGGSVYAGDRSAGSIYKLNRASYKHNGNAVRRVGVAIVPVEDNRPAPNNVTAEFQSGVGLVSGQGENPQCMMRYSEDGLSWSDEISRSFGRRGEYKRRAVFNGLTGLEPPAAAIEIAVSDPVAATHTGLALNRVNP